MELSVRRHQKLPYLPDWFWLAAIAGALRFVNLGAENFWYDESFTAWLASRLPLSNMWQAIQGDVHPPLWYVISFVEAHIFGTSEFALRLPDAILGVVAVVLVWHIALAVGFQRRVAFVAGLLAAVLPAAIYYSQDARMYPLLAVAVLLTTWSAIKGRWALFWLSGTVAVYTQNLGVLYVTALGIAVLLLRWRDWRSAVRPMLALVGIVAAWLPWSVVMIHQMQQMSQGFWLQPMTPGGLLWPLAEMTVGWRSPESLQIDIYGVALGLTAVGLIAGRRWLVSRQGIIILAAMIGAPVLTGLASLIWRSVYLPRAMLPSVLLLMLPWAYVLECLSRPNRRVARLIVIPALAVALVAQYEPAQGGREDVRDWLEPVRAGWQSGDVIFHTALHTAILYGYYLPGLDYEIRPSVSDLNESLSEDTKRAMQFRQAQFDDLRSLGYKRAWLLVYTNPMSRIDEYKEVARITTTYRNLLIRAKDNQFASERIYLVTL